MLTVALFYSIYSNSFSSRKKQFDLATKKCAIKLKESLPRRRCLYVILSRNDQKLPILLHPLQLLFPLTYIK